MPYCQICEKDKPDIVRCRWTHSKLGQLKDGIDVCYTCNKNWNELIDKQENLSDDEILNIIRSWRS